MVNVLSKAKGEIRKFRNGKVTLALLLVIAAFLVLPTGTPDDLFTTVPLIAWLGLENFLVLGAVLALAVWLWVRGDLKL